MTLAHGIGFSEDVTASDAISSDKGGTADEVAELRDERWQSAFAQRSGSDDGRRSFEFQLRSQADSEIAKFSLGLGPKSDSLQASKTLFMSSHPPVTFLSHIVPRHRQSLSFAL